MNFYLQIALVAGIFLVASLVHDCLKQLQQMNVRLQDMDARSEKATKTGEEIHFDMLAMSDSLSRIEKVAADYEVKQPHPFE